jgi:hypothetical protein
VAYQAQPQSLDPVASSAASYHLRTLAPSDVIVDGSGTAMTTPLVKSGKSGAGAKTATTPKPRPAARARRVHRPSTTKGSSPSAGGQTTTPSPSPSGSSSRSPSSTVQQDIANGNYLLAVAQYLVKNGYSDAAAAGAASCVDGESGGNPESVGSGGGGLIGWTPIGSAAPNSNIITGNAPQDMMTQLADMLYYDSTEIGQSLVAQLNTITDPVAAADFFSENFEKPAVTNSDVVPSLAEQVFSELGG